MLMLRGQWFFGVGHDIFRWMFLIKTANTLIMSLHRCKALWISKMQDKMSLMLCWYPYWEGGSDINTTVFAWKGSQYSNYGLLSLLHSLIIQNAGPKMINPPLMLISGMGQCADRFPIYLYRWPMLPLWNDVTMQPFGYQKGRPKIINTSLMLTSMPYLMSLDAQQWYAKMHIVIIGSQYIVSM